MNRKRREPESTAPLQDPALWKVDPGFALGFFHLGMPRHELMQILNDKQLDTTSLARGGPLYVIEMDTKLHFTTEPPYPLNLIEVSNERVRFGKLKIMWDFPHNLFASVPSASTLWFDDLSQINPAFSSSTKSPRNPTDEQLLDGGTLWMKDLGVGFRLTRGKITTLYLCDPANLPQAGAGEFTGAQRHLSERLQIASFKTPIARTPPVEKAFKLGLLLVAILVIAFFGRRAWEEKTLWDNAPESQADVVAVWPPPPEPFPNKFRLTYQDQRGKSYQIELSDNDFYSTPQVGDQVVLRYLPDSPQTALGPIKYRDIAFDRFVPYLLGTIGAYFVLYLASGFVFAWLRDT